MVDKAEDETRHGSGEHHSHEAHTSSAEDAGSIRIPTSWVLKTFGGLIAGAVVGIGGGGFGAYTGTRGMAEDLRAAHDENRALSENLAELGKKFDTVAADLNAIKLQLAKGDPGLEERIRANERAIVDLDARMRAQEAKGR